MPKPPSVNPRDTAEKVALTFGVKSAPVPVDRIAKSLGAILRFSPLDEELSGMIHIKDNVPIIGVNSLHHPHRQRFTIAHEIGHLTLHRHLITTSVHVDKGFPVLMRGVTSALGTDPVEIAANAFASQLLIPQFLLDQVKVREPVDIDDDSPMEELAKKFRVSRKMVEFRLAALG
jgi:Zn-dependent peptidase ImmA (M78 family)